MALQDNLTAILYKTGDLRLEQRDVPQIKDDEVLLQMDSVGICGSDVHYWTTGRCGNFIVKEPMVIGHEASGIVAKLGAKVKNLKVGDRVAIEPGVPCRFCDFCKNGQYNLCPDMAFCATPPYHGNLTRYYAHAADFCYKLPEHMSMEEGALLEPLSVGVHGCRRAGVTAGSSVLILGAGPIGLVTLLTAKAMGATNVLITDLLQSRLDLAKSLGADHTILIKKEDKEEDVVKNIHQTMGAEPEKALDCSGVESTTRLAVLATRSGGVAVMIGMGSSEVKIPLQHALAREVDIRGIFRYCNDYPLALAMVASGQINIKPLVTHHFTIEETVKAFETARAGLGVKVMIHVQPKDTNNK
ncbi:sorbitol dehydrogenase-like [Arctopsyche grandis]|uniref:sorbitol dehydrogenase-like n=1 Tax=Arctopsyche grandis TaxID=121162 RepID=UPI00406D9AA7